MIDLELYIGIRLHEIEWVLFIISYCDRMDIMKLQLYFFNPIKQAI